MNEAAGALYEGPIYIYVCMRAHLLRTVLASSSILLHSPLLLLSYIIPHGSVELIKVTPSRGTAVELASALIVVIGSVIGRPLSTTHCQVSFVF